MKLYGADRTTFLSIRLSAAEREKVDAAAKQAGLNTSRWARKLMLAAAGRTGGKRGAN